MPYAVTDDNVKLYYEEAGNGTPILFIHEFADDLRTWEPQFQYFSRNYRCIAYNARGFPPSDVPETPDRYSQGRATEDARDVLSHLEIDKAHIIGLSQGGYASSPEQTTLSSIRWIWVRSKRCGSKDRRVMICRAGS